MMGKTEVLNVKEAAHIVEANALERIKTLKSNAVVRPAHALLRGRR
jgi:hypothetical protein